MAAATTASTHAIGCPSPNQKTTITPTIIGRCEQHPVNKGCEFDIPAIGLGNNKTNDDLREQANDDIDFNDKKKKKDGGGDDGEKKWRGKVEWKVRGEWSAEQVWEMAGDFCGMGRWVPTLDKCERAAGEENTPGCIRYMEAGGKRADGRPARWVLEQLLDWAHRRYTYKMLDSGYGLTGYLATLELLVHANEAGHGHGHESGHGHGHCDANANVVVQWTFELDPSTFFVTYQGFLAFFIATFERMMLSLEDALHSNCIPNAPSSSSTSM